MSSDLCDAVVSLTSSPQNIISTESIVSVGAGDDASGYQGRGVAPAGGGVELGRKLLLAARAGDTNAVLELMAKGAPFTTDWLGTSPLHLAAANNHAETCAVLLRAGVSRDARTKVERTPLHLAAAAGHAAVVRLLLERGAAADCRDMLRMTPLHWAAARGRLAAARLLLARGADPRLRCKFRKTPRCLALRADRADIVALLDEHEANTGAEQQQLDVQPKPQQLFKRVELKPQTKVKIQSDKKIVIESKTQPIPASANVGRGASASGTASGTGGTSGAGGTGGTGGAGGTGGSGGTGGTNPGAALLRAHGITLLPADRGSTVLTALRSGRTVVLSDAGKLMLKESSASTNEPHIITNTTNTTNANILQVNTTTNLGASVNTSVASEFSANSVDSTIVQGFSKGAKLKPAKFGKGVKLITVNKNQPLKRVIHPNDLQQVKVVRVAAGGRGALKLLMDKTHLQRLLADSRAAAQSQTSTPSYPANEIVEDMEDSSTIDITMEEESVELPGAQETQETRERQETQETQVRQEPQEPQGGSLRAQLSAAHAAIASLGAELRECRARLARYEGGHGH